MLRVLPARQRLHALQITGLADDGLVADTGVTLNGGLADLSATEVSWLAVVLDAAMIAGYTVLVLRGVRPGSRRPRGSGR